MGQKTKDRQLAVLAKCDAANKAINTKDIACDGGCGKPLSTRKALALAVEMLDAIAQGKQYETTVYRSNVERIRQRLALKTLLDADAHILSGHTHYSKRYQDSTDVIRTAIKAVKSERF